VVWAIVFKTLSKPGKCNAGNARDHGEQPPQGQGFMRQQHFPRLVRKGNPTSSCLQLQSRHSGWSEAERRNPS
jgi:hypothetical protein